MSVAQSQLTPHQILAAARSVVIQRAPYFRAGVLAIIPRERPGLGTFASSKNWVMYWDPAKVIEWGVDKTAGVIAHELWHLVRDHFGRFSQPLVNADLANIAGDLSINPGLLKMRFALPEKSLFPSLFNLPDDLTAEQYYEKLRGMNVKYAYCETADGSPIPDGTVIIDGCGSCSGRKRRDEPDDEDEGRSEGEISRVRITIAKDIKQRGRGNAPGDLDRWADEALRPPKVSWRERLARLGRASVAFRPGSGHSTYTRPSRRQAGLGFGPGRPVLPSFRATQPRVAFLADTSGSINPATLTSMMSEAQGVFSACGAAMDFAVCDAELHGMKKVKSIAEAWLMLHGGGGYDFCPAFDEIAKLRPKVDVVVAATDGDITVPAEAPPGVTVIWLLVQRSYNGAFRRPCNWGTVIEVDE